MIRITNTFTGKKEVFKTLTPNRVKMYVCGPTVYNLIHVGNARAAVVFDSFRRYLEYRGYSVTYTQNFTDIDDKIINTANKEGISSKALSDRYIAEYFKDACMLGIKPATFHPRTTDFVKDIINFIVDLEEKNFAYSKNGDVYFDVSAFKSYGALSHRNPADMRAGSRIEINELKDDPLDFTLWKAAKPDEPEWESPWGEGRPGWHIECSVMSSVLLGDSFDIHAGGTDLIFPHHENERAQSEARSGKKWVSYWMHNGMISIKEEKMSKSIGNIFNVREALKVYGPNALRVYLLSKHYRSPIEFSSERMEEAKAAYSRITNALYEIERKIGNEFKVKKDAFTEEWRAHMMEALDDDFNTPQAFSVIFELVKKALSSDKKEELSQIKALFFEWNYFLGFDFSKTEKSADEFVEQLVNLRDDARARKDYAQSDKIRDTLQKLGVEIRDLSDGTHWRWN